MAFQLPGITVSSTTKVNELLAKNHKYDVLFDGIRHNHGAHVLLTCYHLGATAKQLQAQFTDQEHMQRPVAPARLDDPHVAMQDRAVFEAHLGDSRYYNDYLIFFDKEIARLGFDGALSRYYLDPHLYLQALHGILHGLILVGLAVEHDKNKMLLAEGLALCAVQPRDFDVHQPAFTRWCFENNKDGSVRRAPDSQGEGIGLLDILTKVREQKSALNIDLGVFDIMTAIDPSRFTGEAMASKIETLCSQWHLQETQESIDAKLHDLAQVTVYLYAATKHNKDENDTFDFFLLHILTSLYFQKLLLKQFPLNQQVVLLQAYVRYIVLLYIYCGVPEIHPEWLETDAHDETTPSSGSWGELIQQSIQVLDLHMVKVIRSLAYLDSVYGRTDPHNIYYKAALRTVRASKNGFPWVYGIGYDTPRVYVIPTVDDQMSIMMRAMLKAMDEKDVAK
ncbi:hypothetical protein BC940DRAFT_370373 [Gongronella butleri]|nr:hypothetical protein BC940DRAFT_370373 [Gongronella butleri]